MTEEKQTSLADTPTSSISPAAKTEPLPASSAVVEEGGIVFYDDDDGADFSELLKKDQTELKEHRVVRGKVVAVGSEFVTVDIGYKSEGQISIDEFRNNEGKLEVKDGDEVEVFLESMETADGEVLLSKDKANKLQIWEEMEQAFEEKKTVRGKILSRIKGGLAVDIGIKAFLPGSQIDLRPVRQLDKMLNEEFDFKIIKFNKKRANIVLSRRTLLEVDRHKKRQQTLDELKEGALITGCVKNITDYGLFVDLGGIDGLLHVTDISWGRVANPADVYSVGEEVKVLVLKFDKESEKVSLGVKQQYPNPWEKAIDKYPIGSRAKGKIVSLIDYGAFVEIESGIEGLVHVSEMSWTRKVHRPSALFQIGDEVEVIVKSIDIENQRTSLSIKEAISNPWDEIHERYPAGEIVTGKVRNVTDFGVFVGLDEDIDGLVYVSDISWNTRDRKPTNFKKDDEITVKILSVDKEKERISLGIKQLNRDPWEEINHTTAIGDEIEGHVMSVAPFGVFVEIDSGVEGLLHVSEMGRYSPRTALGELYPIGSPVKVIVLKLEIEERRIGLGLSEEEQEARRMPETPNSENLREAVKEVAEEEAIANKEKNAVTDKEEATKEALADKEKVSEEATKEAVADKKEASEEAPKEAITDKEEATKEALADKEKVSEEATKEAVADKKEASEEAPKEAVAYKKEATKEALADKEKVSEEATKEAVADKEEIPANPESTDSKFTDSKFTDSKFTDSEFTDSKSTDSKSTDSKSTDSKFTDSKSTDSEFTDSKSTDS